MPKIMIHACCAHCTAYTVQYFRNEGYETTAFWYNPNIHPFMEHQSRLQSLKSLAENMSFPLIVAEGYGFIDYLRAVQGHEDKRCADCFNMRLLKTAQAAIENKIYAFTTSLLISPHQDHELVKKTGREIDLNTGAAFVYADLRKRYSESRHITKPMDLYRQQYCGCIYSEYERYTGSRIQVGGEPAVHTAIQ
jgi:predicted adenine nucleotide alpha hydrolase (AANH) superfamily ATPase